MRAISIFAAAQQSLLLVTLFLTLVLSLFLLLYVCTNHPDRRIQALQLSVSLILFALLSVLADTFEQAGPGNVSGNVPGNGLPVGMAFLWGTAGGADLLLLWELLRLYRAGGRSLNRNSIKEAMDRLPGGICYFTGSGSVKLCNLQMLRLFRSFAQKDLQRQGELEEALEDCGPDTGVLCLSGELQNYLFPDGRVWQYRRYPVKDEAGTSYTEVVFSDLTEQYEREQELKKQTKELEEISRKLKHLSDNVQILTREKEVLAAKTRLHDQMGAALTAVRQLLLHPEAAGTGSAVKLLRQAVSAVKNDREYPPEQEELAKFLQDAAAVGVRITLTGALPESGEQSFVCLLAMRECLSNGVRHAGATELRIALTEDDSSVSIHITNDGTPPKGEIVPRGGLHNLYRYVLGCGGRLQIQSAPSFAMTITLPKAGEGMV